MITGTPCLNKDMNTLAYTYHPFNCSMCNSLIFIRRGKKHLFPGLLSAWMEWFSPLPQGVGRTHTSHDYPEQRAGLPSSGSELKMIEGAINHCDKAPNGGMTQPLPRERTYGTNGYICLQRITYLWTHSASPFSFRFHMVILILIVFACVFCTI